MDNQIPISQPSTAQQEKTQSDTYKKGSFWERAAACILDIILIFIIDMLMLNFVLGPDGLLSSFSSSSLFSYIHVFILVFTLFSLPFSILFYIPFFIFFSLSFSLPFSILVFILFSIITALYAIFFLGMAGETPGMMVLKLKVLSTSYQKIGMRTSFIREIASFLSSPIFNLGYFWVLIDSKEQTWHDKLAHTFVVKLDAAGKLIPTSGDRVVTTRREVAFWLLLFGTPLAAAIMAYLLLGTLSGI